MKAITIMESATGFYPPEWAESEMASVTYDGIWNVFMLQLQYYNLAMAGEY